MLLSRLTILVLLYCCTSGTFAGAGTVQQPHVVTKLPLIVGGADNAPDRGGWDLTVYGAQPILARDTQVTHSGEGALRIAAETPSDAALGREVRLKPDRFYRLRAWVRTRGLDPHGAPVSGALQVQGPGGQGILASSASRRGDIDWSEATAPFLSPADGRVRLCLFFVGFGKGTGSVWFDDVRLEEVDLSMSAITVTREPVCPGTISPMQYGQFIEYLCDLVPSMWAEKLYDGSFEGLSSYKFVYLKESDFKEKPWTPCGATNRADYSLDRATKVSGDVSQRIAVVGATPCTVGLVQRGIAVEKGIACRFSCYFKQEGVAGPVSVSLHRGPKVLASAEFTAGGEWHKVEARLAPSETESDAVLTIAFRGPGTLWLDNASLMPEDNVGGWRRDVVQALKELQPGVIRFGGSALDDGNLGDFHWLDTIGDPNRRKPFRAWGGLQPTGPGLEEIVQLCYAVGAEPLICVRIRNSTPAEAAQEVEYFNGGADTPMGAMRARNGRAAPYHIRFWQIGNEQAGREYEERLPLFCRAMRQADPTIKLMSSYPTEGVLRGSGDLLDYVCPHHYGCADLGAMQADFTRIRELIAAEAPGRTIHVGVTEWNTTAGDAGTRRAMLWTLENAIACSRYHNLMHRNADLVEIANRSNLTNSFCSGIIQADNHRLYKTPTYYAQKFYATLAGNKPLALRSDVPPEIGPDLSATLSSDGKTVTLFAVNPGEKPVSRPIDLSAFGAGGQSMEVWTLADRRQAGEPDAANSFDDPTRIAPVRSAFHAGGPRFTYEFPAYSLTVLRWNVGK